MSYFIFFFTQFALAQPPEHALFSDFLHEWVVDGHVDYSGIRQHGQPALTAYEAQLQAHPPQPSWNKKQTLAYWINTYNAYTLQLIVDHPTVKSIREIGSWTQWSPWSKRFIPLNALGQSQLTLDEIEHQLIRARFNEPRIHFALVCASKSCPPLRSEAYLAKTLDQQLDQQARAFLTDPRKNHVEADGLHLSPIFKWYGEDFTKGGRTLQDYVQPYMNTTLPPGTPIIWNSYDWSLNGH